MVIYEFYKAYEEQALKTRSNEDIEKLAEWFENYGQSFWNGEYYQINKDYKLMPIYHKIDDDYLIVTSYTLETA